MAQWETVCRENTSRIVICTDRLGVPGGWLYRVTIDTAESADPALVSMVFVPDPKMDNTL